MIQITGSALLRGLGLGFGLIVAIGAQNAYVLRQGLRRQYVFVTALTSLFGDAVLITLGVAGLGTIIAQSAILSFVATWGGAAFLLFFGFRSFRSAIKPGVLETETAGDAPHSMRRAALTTLAFSLLNPHVYLDTVVLIGSVGARFPANERFSFGLGAVIASAVWFFGLVYGAALVAPLFRRPVVWQALDIFVGCVMWLIAFSLIGSALGGGL